jgi:predicted nucleotidyltransferase
MSPEAVEEIWSMLDRDYLASVALSGTPPVFATVSGAHLYGFASKDSDVDLRGAFLLPLRAMLGLRTPKETVTIEDKHRIDLDFVAHDLRKFARMMTNHNGYVLEQLYSPLVVVTTALFEELRELGRGCVTRPTVRHYQGFARGRRKRLHEPDPTVKHLLYAYRVLLSGTHLMRTGEVEANLDALNRIFCLQVIDELIDRKRRGAEKMALSPSELESHDRLLDELELELERAHERSHLPEEPTSRAALDDFVVRARLASDAGGDS